MIGERDIGADAVSRAPLRNPIRIATPASIGEPHLPSGTLDALCTILAADTVLAARPFAMPTSPPRPPTFIRWRSILPVRLLPVWGPWPSASLPLRRSISGGKSLFRWPSPSF